MNSWLIANLQKYLKRGMNAVMFQLEPTFASYSNRHADSRRSYLEIHMNIITIDIKIIEFKLELNIEKILRTSNSFCARRFISQDVI